MRIRLAILVAALAAAPRAAEANGRFPDTIAVHFHPTDDDVLALQATWGLIVSRDGGDTWGWICEEAVGFAGVFDPDYAYTPTGLLLATTTSFDGLRLTRDDCTWTPAPAPLGPVGDQDPGTLISQLEVASDGRIFAAASEAGDSQIYVSDDDAASFTAISNPGDGVDWWESMVVAPQLLPGGEARIYLAGYNVFAGEPDPIKERLLFRSDDSGETWISLPLGSFSFGTYDADLQLVAVSPTDPSLVFARVFLADGAVGDDLYRSTDGGETWTRVFQSIDYLTAVVVRASGEVVIAEQGGFGSDVGIRVSDDDGQTFGDPIAGSRIKCLAERDGVLHACGDGFAPESMALGTGTVAGEWTKVLDYASIDAPVSCAAGTVQRDVCEDSRWDFIVCQFGIDDPEVDCGDAPDAATVDAGDGEEPPKKGCLGCSAGGSAAGGGLVAIALAVMMRRSTRRRRAGGSG